MTYVDASPDVDLATEWFASRVVEQKRAHSGAALRQWAATVAPRLPRGHVTLLSTSVEGCALAAVVAALREEETTWEYVSLGRSQPERGGKVVVLEPVRLAEGTREVLARVLPDALVIDSLAASLPLASVA